MQPGGTPPREPAEFTRILAFTDGVFAIAITLLVLSIEVPAGLTGRELTDYLLDSWPQVFAYFLSFAVIGNFWVAHHRFFEMLHGFDGRLVTLNLAYLSLLVLVPFPTELLGDYTDRTDAVVLYAAVVGTTALLGWLMVRYTLRRGHVRADARKAVAASGSLLPPLVFYASIPVAFVSPLAAKLVWLGLLVEARPRRR
jgi:uncharacterized membrane protein